MPSNYWSQFAATRITRRRSLIAGSSVALASAFLAACGGGAKSGDEITDVKSLETKLDDSSKQAKRGGTIVRSRNADIFNWDPYILNSQWNTTFSAIFMRMTIIKPGYMEPSKGIVEGNLAESWETSPDRLTLTMKVRPGIVFHPTPPVNGRTLDVDDVLFSWKRFLASGTSRADYANALNPEAPIVSVNASDPTTIVFKLSRPMATLPALMSYEYGGHFHIVPKEADGGFDLRRQAIGSGPFMVTNHEVSLGVNFKRHPGFYDKERPYIDNYEWKIVPEYATGLAAFKAGSLHSYPVKPQDILVTKSDSPSLQIFEADMGASKQGFSFGWRPDSKSPFKDERLRQALSMALDRDLFTEVISNVSKFESAGIPMETRWNSALAANFYDGWWIDPRSKDFGPNSKYYQLNQAEAKKLMAAAGFANGLEMTAPFADNTTSAIRDENDVVLGMAADIGMKFTPQSINYNTEWQPKYRDARGDYDGLIVKSILGGDTDATENMISVYSARSAQFTGLDAAGVGNFKGDPYVEDQLTKARAEIDDEKRRSILKDVQKYLGQKQYMVRFPGGASGLELSWPGVRNHRLLQAPQVSFRGADFHEWIDESLPPFKKG